jgi:hypothetical protein
MYPEQIICLLPACPNALTATSHKIQTGNNWAFVLVIRVVKTCTDFFSVIGGCTLTSHHFSSTVCLEGILENGMQFHFFFFFFFFFPWYPQGITKKKNKEKQI